MLLRKVPGVTVYRRSYATIQGSQHEGGAITIDPNVYRRTTVKAPNSKKSLMHAEYVSFYKANPTMLVLQHNNLTQAQLLKIRTELKPLGARLRIIRVGIFQHAVKVVALQAQSGEKSRIQSLDVNSIVMSKRAKANPTRDARALDLTNLLIGPVCTITFSRDASGTVDVSPETLKKTLSVVSSTRSQLILMGGKFENRVFGFRSLERVTQLPDLTTIRGQLLSLLGASASRITQLLGSPASSLGRTLEGRKVALQEQEPGEKQ